MEEIVGLRLSSRRDFPINSQSVCGVATDTDTYWGGGGWSATGTDIGTEKSQRWRHTYTQRCLLI